MSIEEILNILAQALPIIAGLLGIPIIQWIKNLLNVSSDAGGVGLAGAVSAVLAAAIYGIAVASGAEELVLSLEGILGALPVVFGVATAVFKLIGGNQAFA
jgi:hypothetical protein